MVDGLHGEVERHELADGAEALERRADGDAGEPSLRDRGVDDALVAPLLPQAARHLVGAVVLGNLSRSAILNEQKMRKGKKKNGKKKTYGSRNSLLKPPLTFNRLKSIIKALKSTNFFKLKRILNEEISPES